MKNIKKILALALALVMVLGISSVALAADATLSNDGPVISNENTLVIKKAVVVDNGVAGIEVAYPAITYTYNVTPVAPTANATVTDNNVTVDIKEGVTGTVTFTDNTAAIATNKVAMNAQGQEVVTDTVTLQVTTDNFTSPGVYRYKISENDNAAARAAAGIVRVGTVATDYFLDVYIGWKDADPTSADHVLIVKGYVLTKENKETIDPSTEKESGFDSVTYSGDKLDASTKVETNNDFYYTYNVTLTKKVAGTMGDTDHEFPFNLDVTNNSLGYIVSKIAAPTGTDAQIPATLATSVSLKDSETATIFGLSPFATVKYTETNDTSSEYQVSAKDASAAVSIKVDGGEAKTAEQALPAGKAAAMENAAAVAETFNATAKAAATDAKAITFTNKLDDISATGVALRVAPFVMILAAGCMMLLIGKRRKEAEEA